MGRYADGKIQYQGDVIEGNYCGNGKEYHFNGQAISEGRYKNGGKRFFLKEIRPAWGECQDL